MKPKNLPRISPINSCFSAEKHKLSHFLDVWHYHKEIELVYIKKSTGIKFIGDSMEKFATGELILIGSYLPHLILNDKIYFEDKDKHAEAWVIHFDPECFGKEFFNAPDLNEIKNLFREAQFGLKIYGDNKRKVVENLKEIYHQENTEKIISLLNILRLISKSKYDILASRSYVMNTCANNTWDSNSKLEKIYSYIMKNFTEDINLTSVAEYVNMNPSAFSRFFKKATNKSFINFLIELRIGFACKIMLEDNYKTIAEVCYESGFNNISNFNKQFKKITQKTPMEYLESHKHFVKI